MAALAKKYTRGIRGEVIEKGNLGPYQEIRIEMTCREEKRQDW